MYIRYIYTYTKLNFQITIINLYDIRNYYTQAPQNAIKRKHWFTGVCFHKKELIHDLPRNNTYSVGKYVHDYFTLM